MRQLRGTTEIATIGMYARTAPRDMDCRTSSKTPGISRILSAAMDIRACPFLETTGVRTRDSSQSLSFNHMSSSECLEQDSSPPSDSFQKYEENLATSSLDFYEPSFGCLFCTSSPPGGATEYQLLQRSLNCQVANRVAKNDNLALSPTFRYVSTE
ncbi:hypothetical protein TNCV_2276231 [Trichonephila clavipes]|nr:hypothetical protein TNCV_2276231 [Trichonephila clavipes]